MRAFTAAIMIAVTMATASQASPVTVIVDAKAVLYLLGTRMDVKTDNFSSTFVFENPNQTSACGCGESVALSPADAARSP